MSETVVLKPGSVSLRDVQDIVDMKPVRLDDRCWPRVEAAQRIVAAAALGSDAVYGVNTGFGKLASRRIPKGQTAQLQRNLILSHCCGVGPSTPFDVVQLMMALKVVSLGQGASGVRREVIELLVGMINHRVWPIIPAQGSVGASGDLAPLAHMAAAMIGEGEVHLDGKRLAAKKALARCGLKPVVLEAKEGLALINGTQFSTALALIGLLRAQLLAKTALATGALSVDAAMGSTVPFRREIQALRGQTGQIAAARSLMALLDGSEIRSAHLKNDERVQDPYCLRCQPQVMGAVLDLLSAAARTLVIEANAVTDNPLVLVETGEIVSGGNFHAEPVAFAADQIALAISETGAIAERRIATLVDPALNYGLPPFLTPHPGINSGFMIAEVTAAALFAENKQRATPCSIDSTPTSANQEDHVSMAAHGARRLLEMTENLATIIGIELLVGAQGVELRGPLRTSAALQRVVAYLRRFVPKLEEDRVLSGDITNAAGMVMSGRVVDAAGDIPFPELAMPSH